MSSALILSAIGVIVLFGVWHLYLVDRDEKGDISVLNAIRYGVYVAVFGLLPYVVGFAMSGLNPGYGLVPLGILMSVAVTNRMKEETRKKTLTGARERDYMLYGLLGILVTVAGICWSFL